MTPVAFVPLFLGLLLFVKGGDSSFNWLWIYRWLLMEGLLLGYLAFGVGNNWLVRICFGYLLLHTLYFSQLPFWMAIPADVQQALHLSAGQELGIVFTLLLAWIHFSGRRDFWKVTCRGWLAVVGAILVVTSFFMRDINIGPPLLHNPSITGSFIAVILAGTASPWLAVAGVGALFWLKASTPLVALMVALPVRWFFGRAEKRWLYGVWLALFPLVGLFGASKLHDGNGRFAVWQIAWEWITQDWKSFMIGSGLGSVPVLVPLLQLNQGADNSGFGFFLYLHNDWLQILFELGALGLLLALTLYFRALWRSRKDPRWQAMGVAYGVVMCTNFPWHSPLLAFLGMVLLAGSADEA